MFSFRENLSISSIIGVIIEISHGKTFFERSLFICFTAKSIIDALLEGDCIEKYSSVSCFVPVILENKISASCES